MRELIPKDEYGIFADTYDTARADSLFVAEFFDKQHKNVLRDIEKLTAPTSGLSEEFNRLNFALISYKDSRGRTQKAYAITRDGFTMLVMGYTGKKAMKFKEIYIKRFNEMEQFIKTLVSAQTLRNRSIMMHIHDEIVIEANKNISLEAVFEQMIRTPDWDAGLQLRADRYEIDFYRKN